jgi:predicted component of type VI protein secretion system
MAVKIRVRKDADQGKSQEYSFPADVITIGREASCTVQLGSPHVSKVHAKIERRGDAFFLTDQKSRNATFVNDEKLAPEAPRQLKVGDTLRICDFFLDILGLAVPVAPGSPVVSPGEPSAVREAPDVLHQLVNEYRGAETLQRRADLKQALVATLQELEKNDLAALAAKLEEVRQECERLRTEREQLRERLASSEPAVEQSNTSLSESEQTGRMKRALEAVLPPFLRLIRGIVSFRTEFLGMTMLQEPELAALSAGSTHEQMAYLLDATIPQKQSEGRMETVESQSEEIIPHVIGLLDGYRKSAEGGARLLLQTMDPERIQSELAEGVLKIGPLQIPYRAIPLVFDRMVLRAVKQKHRELQEEDRGILEKRFFRPGFIQGYQVCVASTRDGHHGHQEGMEKNPPLKADTPSRD